MQRKTGPARLLGLFIAFSCSSALSQQIVVQLWPHATPEKPTAAGIETDTTRPDDGFINGHRTARLTNVSHPTITIYRPSTNLPESGAAALVFPGGSYQILAWDGEGVDTCTWLTSIGVTCLLVKYRVPENGRYPDNFAPLEDAQQAMRLARIHAREWTIDPARIGVVGFSAGGVEPAQA